ncbi:hypothetical protein ACYPKM_04890 [Pseudomonas aeruginosa]
MSESNKWVRRVKTLAGSLIIMALMSALGAAFAYWQAGEMKPPLEGYSLDVAIGLGAFVGLAISGWIEGGLLFAGVLRRQALRKQSLSDTTTTAL